jgi:putative membrane protein PagO
VNNLFYLLLCLIWGTTWLVIKIGLDDLPPFLAASLRFVIASSLLFAVARLKRPSGGKRQKEPHLFYFALSFCWITIPYGLVYWGEQYVASGLSAILFATMPFYVALMGHFLLVKETLTPRRVLGLLVGFLGLLVIFFGTTASPSIGAARGVIALMLSPLAAAISNVWVKRRVATLHPISMNACMMGYGAVFLFVLSLTLERGSAVSLSGKAVFSLFYLAILGSALAFALYVQLLKSETALKMSLIVYITPVIALFVGWLFRGETVTPVVALGSALVLLGVYMVTKRRVRSRSKAE